MSKEILSFVAEKKMKLYSKKSSIYTLTTLWRDEVITIDFNVAQSSILNVHSFQNVSVDDLNILENIIFRFLS